MTFKDIIAADLNVFLNLDEFSSTHNINGKNYNIIVDNDRLKERSQKEYDGISVGEILFFVAKKDFGSRPEPGTPMVFDGRQMYLFGLPGEDMGMYEIILSQNRGG